MTRVVHCKKEPFDVYIGRPSKWGNPYHWNGLAQQGFNVWDRDAAISCYREWIKTKPELLESLSELKGKILGCWCAPKACHGDVLVELINKMG